LDEQNANRLVSALEDFGFGSLGLTPADFLEEGVVVQLGYPPKRIDILTQVDGVQFDPWCAVAATVQLITPEISHVAASWSGAGSRICGVAVCL
jgi:hypothetical protein